MAGYIGDIFHILISLCLFVGVYDVMKNCSEHCECEMSYMYEPPQYKKVMDSVDMYRSRPTVLMFQAGDRHNIVTGALCFASMRRTGFTMKQEVRILDQPTCRLL